MAVLSIMFAGGEDYQVEAFTRTVIRNGHRCTRVFAEADILVVLEDAGALPNRMAGDRPEVLLWNDTHLVSFLNGDEDMLKRSLKVTPHPTKPAQLPKPAQPDTYGTF